MTSSLRRGLRRNGRTVGVGVALVVLFSAALAYWGRGADLHTGDDRAARLAPPGKVALPQGVQFSTSAAASPGASGSGSNGLSLPPLPSVSASIQGGPRGTHTVRLTASSDQEILRVGYKVSGAKPETVKRSYVRSPLSVTVTGRGDGLLAEIGVQASARASTITCSITVDGVVTSTHTSKGAYAVAVCIG